MKTSMRNAAIASFALVGATAGFSLSANAASTTFNANARIIPAILFTSAADLEFADVIPDVASQTVQVAADSTRTCSGALLCSGTAAAASFSVQGAPNATYAITLPGSANIINTAPTVDTMLVHTFTSSEPLNVGTLDASGVDTFTVGATLDVGAAQVQGSYSGNFVMTVNYN